MPCRRNSVSNVLRRRKAHVPAPRPTARIEQKTNVPLSLATKEHVTRFDTCGEYSQPP